MKLWLTACVAIACAARASRARMMDRPSADSYLFVGIFSAFRSVSTKSAALRTSLNVKSYGFTPVVLSVAAIASSHGDAEFLPQDALGPAIQIIYDTVKTTGGH